MQNMGKVLHNIFKAVDNDIFQVLPSLVESGSEVSYFFTEPRNFSELTRLSEDTNKPCLKTSIKYINNLINIQTFLVDDPEKGEPMTLCMDVYRVNI